MKPGILLDTGPLVALLNARDRHHAWAKHAFAAVEPPLSTCEAVLSEACHLLERGGAEANPVFRLAEQGVIALSFHLGDHMESVGRLLHRYRSVPMSLADACLVRMSELHDAPELLTLDSDFRVYRRHGRQAIPIISPT